MKPKPHSIRHRFFLLQCAAFALATWFLLGALYFNEQIRGDLPGPLQSIQADRACREEMQAEQTRLLRLAEEVRLPLGAATRAAFDHAARALAAAGEHWMALAQGKQERRTLQTITVLERRLVEMAAQELNASQTSRIPGIGHAEIRHIERQIHFLQNNLIADHLQALQETSARAAEHTRVLYLLLLAFGLFGALALLMFRRIDRSDVWAPLDELQRVVAEMRRGNLSPLAQIPRSVEFGPLLEGFLAMAGELRLMRDSLEEKVRQRTAALATAQEELIQAAKLAALGELVAGVAHEINNPLTSILGFTELSLAQPGLPENLRQPLESVRDESLRLRFLVANLSAFARRAPRRVVRLDLREVLDALVELRRYQLAAEKIELRDQRPSDPVWVEGDRDHLLQVLFNLVNNSEQAIRACHRGGEIALSCGSETRRAWIAVRDTGVGISPAILPRIFDPFFTTKPCGTGSGLGLSISHGIIAQHHGTLSAESVEGQGTTMRISLPLASSPALPATHPRPGIPAAALVPSVGLPPGVLIVDDEPALTEFIAAFLSRRGLRPVVLNDPAQLNCVLEREDLGAVLCDLKMPGRNGMEILRDLREKRPDLAERFILMSGDLAGTEAEWETELARLPVLRKPFTLEQLASVLRNVFHTPDEPPRNPPAASPH